MNGWNTFFYLSSFIYHDTVPQGRTSEQTGHRNPGDAAEEAKFTGHSIMGVTLLRGRGSKNAKFTLRRRKTAKPFLQNLRHKYAILKRK